MLKRTLLTNVLFFISLFFSLNCMAQARYKLQGKVVDLNTKEPLKNVSISIKENKSGGITDDSGNYNIVVRIPKFTVVVSAVGYVSTTRLVDLSSDNKILTTELEKRADATLDEVVVNATKEMSKVKVPEMNIVKINP